MAEVKVFYDQTGNTLTVWFGNPQDEHICEETGDEVILMKKQTRAPMQKQLGQERLISRSAPRTPRAIAPLRMSINSRRPRLNLSLKLRPQRLLCLLKVKRCL